MDPEHALQAIHFDSHICSKPFHPVGNLYLEITDPGVDPVCNCKVEYAAFETLELSALQFGSCPINANAAIFARQFASSLRPSITDLALFDVFVKEYFEFHHPFIEKAIEELLEEDCTMAKFLLDSDGKKRKIYQLGFDRFIETGNLPLILEQFSKTNEAHYDSIEDVRMRCLTNPSPELKAVGGLLARLMIKIAKIIEPGFISGYSEVALADKLLYDLSGRNIDPNSADWYSYDGSAHDSHQHPEIIEIVDHFFMRTYLPSILQKTEFPLHLHQIIIDALTQSKLKFFNKNGLKGWMTGTVYSGHPTRTTLFNTWRTILYNRYVCMILAPGHPCYVLVSGDDVLVYLEGCSTIPSFKSRLTNLLGGDSGFKGLGQCAKELLLGNLETHVFLSKKIHRTIDEAAVHRLNSKLIKAGNIISLTSPLETQEHATMQIACMSDITEPQLPFRSRWAQYADGRLSKKVGIQAKSDWAYRLRFLATKQSVNLDHYNTLYDDETYILKAIRCHGQSLTPSPVH
jgi:hypothetical protein